MATQRHCVEADNGGGGRTGYWECAAESASVVDAGKATNKQRRDGFAGGMVVPMVTWSR